MTIKQALISVSDKTGVLEFAQGLAAQGVKLLSTGGTAKMLRDAGLTVTEIGDYTGFPEMLDGRVKTLHPKVHGGILARRDLAEHMATIEAHGIPMIDLVCVNLYPFAATIAKAGVTLEDAIENIDIGGPAMVRSSAKNYAGVAIVTDPADYQPLLAEMKANCRRPAAGHAFRPGQESVHAHRPLRQHDRQLADRPRRRRRSQAGRSRRRSRPSSRPSCNWRSTAPKSCATAKTRTRARRSTVTPNVCRVRLPITPRCRARNCPTTTSPTPMRPGNASSPSTLPACVIVKHANPCGVAIDGTLLGAYEKSFKTDSTSAFGGIIAFNGEVGIDVVNAMSERKHFVEVLIAPFFSEEALAALAAKQNLRVLIVPMARDLNKLELKRVGGGLLVQTADNFTAQASGLKIVTKVQPTAQQIEDLLFAERVAKFVKSNAIVFCGGGMTLGVGAGQMSRVDSTKIASIKAQHAGLSLQGSVVASDAFFPFRDGVDVLAEAGAKAVIQPGGSMRDEEVIAAADEHGLAMVFTGARHFRH